MYPEGTSTERGKPRIYIAIATFHPLVGGAERQALLQGCALRERGYDATVVTLRHDRTWPQQEGVEGVPVVRVAGAVLGGREKLPAPLRKLAYLVGVLTMGWALWRRRRSYDLLHVYQLNVAALPATFACWLARKPLIVALRCGGTGRRASSGSHEGQQLAPDDGQGRVRGDLEVLEQFGKPVVRSARYLLRHARAVMVVLSTRMQAELAAHGFTTVGVQIIPNGVDIERFRPVAAETSPASREQVVLYVGRLSYQKGVDVLLRAWRVVCEELPACERARLVIVGIGPQQVQLEQLARTLDITDSVEFAGLKRDVGAWLRRSNLLVLPSRWEGMPNAVLEAMASGLPCVTTRVSGSEDIIQHGVNGLLVEPEDQQELARALLTLLRNPAQGHQYGHAARVTVETRYSLEHVMDIYVDLYQSLYRRRRKPAPPVVIQQVSMSADAAR